MKLFSYFLRKKPPKKLKTLKSPLESPPPHPTPTAVNLEQAVYDLRYGDSQNTREKQQQISGVLKSDINTERRGKKGSNTEAQRLLENTHSFFRQLPAGSPFTGRMGRCGWQRQAGVINIEKTPYLASLLWIAGPVQAAGADVETQM